MYPPGEVICFDGATPGHEKPLQYFRQPSYSLSEFILYATIR